MLIHNPRARRVPYPTELRAIMSVTRARESRDWLSSWSRLSPGPTPVRELPDLAAGLNIGKLYVKDEALRSPLGSFKALGAPIALVRQILRLFPEMEACAVLDGEYAVTLKDFTVISATDGNHGRSLAAAAHDAGCRCVIVLHANVSMEREQAIAAYGARIVRITGNYDDSVNEAARLATENGWHVISDTSYERYEGVPRDVMQGYSIAAAEVIDQLDAGNAPAPVTHVFIQGGVGGLAAAIVSYMWESYGSERPRFIVVEPQQADCLYQSALAGEAAKATGTVDSLMAGLACGEPSALAWRFLDTSVDHFMLVSDADAIQAMRRLAAGTTNDIPVISGESGAAGLAGLLALTRQPEDAAQVGLDAHSRVLVINTEGATAPTVYAECVGEPVESVLERQAAWTVNAA
jgi:diaminopropionate ammonia-lyase family